MTALEIENRIAKSCLTYIEKLSPEVRLDIITKISNSLKNKHEKVSREQYYAGIWDSDKTPEEFAESLRAARCFNRKQIEL